MRDQHSSRDQLLEEWVPPHAAGFARERIGTRNRRAPEAVRPGEARFRLLAENLEGHAAFLLDAQGHVTSWNAGAERLLGYRAEEILGESFACFFPVEDVWRGEPEQHLAAAIGGRWEDDGEHVRKDGTRFPAHVLLMALVSAGAEEEAYLLVLRELAPRRELEAALNLRTRALDLLTEGVFLLDVSRSDNSMVYANPAFVQMAGRPREQLLGRAYCPPRGPADDAIPPPDIRAVLVEQRPWSGELAATRPDGGPAWHRLSLCPVADAADRVTHFLGVQVDVTERKYCEEWFRQAQKMTAIGWLAGSIVHDFNNLLTVIMGHCDILLKQPRVEGIVREGLQEILHGGEWGAALTGQLLGFCRSQAPEPHVLDVGVVLVKTSNLLRRLLVENIELDCVVHPDLGLVRADAGQLEQVLVNLIVNARDAMPEGGRITVEATNVSVAAGQAAGEVQPGAYVLLSVADTGSGMPSDVLEDLFRPLFTTKEQGKGTGLGLYTVQQIVQQSGGFIRVASQLGHGSRFEVYLPRVEDSSVAATSGQETACTGCRGLETLLLVEHETGVRDVLCRALRLAGYTVLAAGDGAEALAACEHHGKPVQLLLTDVVMPKMSAPRLVTQLTAKYPQMKILYLSGYPLPTGASFLPKPFSLESLTCRVRQVLDGKN